MTDPLHNDQNPGTGYEERDLGSRPVYAFLVVLVITGVVVYFTVWGIFFGLQKFFDKHQGAMSPMAHRSATPPRTVTTEHVENTFPGPRLETDERSEINDFRLGEEQRLNSYDWVDQTDSVVRIPITEAMKLVAQRGLPTRPQTGVAPASTVKMVKAAAAASDNSAMPKKPAGTQTRKKK